MLFCVDFFILSLPEKKKCTETSNTPVSNEYSGLSVSSVWLSV